MKSLLPCRIFESCANDTVADTAWKYSQIASGLLVAESDREKTRPLILAVFPRLMAGIVAV